MCFLSLDYKKCIKQSTRYLFERVYVVVLFEKKRATTKHYWFGFALHAITTHFHCQTAFTARSQHVYST